MRRILKQKSTEENKNSNEKYKIFIFFELVKYKIIDFMTKLKESKFCEFVKVKWSSEVDLNDLYLLYCDLLIDYLNNKTQEFYTVSNNYHKNTEYYNQLKQAVGKVKKDKPDVEVNIDNMEQELRELDVKINQDKNSRESIANWLNNMANMKNEVVIDISNQGNFKLEYIKRNHKILIIYFIQIIISVAVYLMFFREVDFIWSIGWLCLLTFTDYYVAGKLGIEQLRKYVYMNDNLWDRLKIEYRKAYYKIESYNKEKKVEDVKTAQITQKLRSEESSTNVNQQKQQIDLNKNPYTLTWMEIFDKFFKNHEFKAPDYEKFDTTEVHIFNIPTLSLPDITNKAEQIENFMGKRIYKIHKEYNGIGRIGVELEISELPRIIDYCEVPIAKGKGEIVIGKSLKDWVTWDLYSVPHGLVVGSTGGGKSVTMNFLINEVVKKGWLAYFVDFKGGAEFGIYKDKNYTVITERNEFVNFTSNLHGEVEFRSRLLGEYRVKNLDEINKKLRMEQKHVLPRTIVFLDEYADVNAVEDEFTKSLNANIGKILAKGRAAGVHLIIGTQRPDSKTIGAGAFRDNIGCRIVGRMNSESAYAMSFGTSTLTKEDKVYVNKMPDDSRFKGMFIVQGTGTINDKEIIRVPFMKDEDFQEMVLIEWKDNPYFGYQLHSLEEDEEIEEVMVENKREYKERTFSERDYL